MRKNKLLLLLALLMTAATGAWADETLLTTITPTGTSTYSATTDDVVDVQIVGMATFAFGCWIGSDGGSITITPKDGYNISKCVFKLTTVSLSTTVSNSPFVINCSGGSFTGLGNIAIDAIEVYGTAPSASSATAVDIAWNASTKTGTFSMPGSDVVLTPQYAPTAKWDEVETVPQLPAALEGIIAGQDAAIVTAGQSAQGTVMYAVTPTAEAAPALTAFSATVPTAKTYDDATTVYVWYYIQGHDTPDGQQATEENTFNDSEISATPLKVDILTNKFDLTLSPAPVKNMTVTVAGQAKTPTDEGKVEAVKMQSEVKLKAATGYKFRKVEVKKTPKQ